MGRLGESMKVVPPQRGGGGAEFVLTILIGRTLTVSNAGPLRP